MELMIIRAIEYIKKYEISLSLNLDYNDILNPSMKKILIDNLKDKKYGKYLTIEILESKKISNYYLVNDFINELKAMMFLLLLMTLEVVFQTTNTY